MYNFITFEGGEGSGKTTQSKKLFEYLVSMGVPTVLTREIGGTDTAEKIREIVVNTSLSKRTELLLILAARSEHIEKVIKPALAEGNVVICDRFIDSTASYQSDNEEEIQRIFYLNQLLFGNFLPEKTFYLKVDPEVGLKRAIERGDTNKYEMKNIDFHKKITVNYEFLAKSFSYRITTIESNNSESAIFEKIKAELMIG